jgi:hypothetical protein
MMQEHGHDNGNGREPGKRQDDVAPDSGDLYADLERRAFFELSEDDDELPAEDLVALAGGAAEPAEPAADVSLGGYIEKHNRVPAFDGSDGLPYTVDIDVEEDGAVPDAPFTAFLIFIRWAATGAGIMDHLESGDMAHGASEEEARRAAMELSLYEVKAELDEAIARRRAALED